MAEPSNDPMQRWQDTCEITELVHEYCVRVDRYEPERVAELFFEDCTVDYGPSLGGPGVGRKDLAAKLRGGLARYEATHHQVSNLQIRFESADRATGRSYVTAWHGAPGDDPDFIVYGQYDDVYELRDGRWGIAERRILVAGDDAPFHIEWNRTPRRKPS